MIPGARSNVLSHARSTRLM